MLKKNSILFVTIILILINSIGITLAQESEDLEYNQQLIEVSTDKLEYLGNENAALLRKFKIIGISPGNINVSLFSGDLYDNSSGKTISDNRIEISVTSFTLTQNQEKKVNVTLNTSEGDKGIYQGKIIVTAIDVNKPSNVIKLELKVTANIQIEEKMSLYSFISDFGFFLILIVVIVGYLIERFVVKFNLAREHKETVKLSIIVILGILVVYIYITMLVNAKFGDISSAFYTAISTLLVAPFLGYVVKYVNDQRTNWNETLKTAREIMSEGINMDIEILRNLIGEFAAHYSGFKPNLFEETVPTPDNTSSSWRKSEIETSSRILYQETGLLPNKVWKENRREGMISNIPTLRLEKYYNLVELYNKYYSCALKLTKSKNFEIKLRLSEDKKYLVDSITNDDPNEPILQFIKKFEKFRSYLASLESVLYVHLLYNLGLISTSYLSPLKVKYPRINRVLLYKLIEYGILLPDNYLHKIVVDKELVKEFEKEFGKKYPNGDENKFKEKKFEWIIDNWLNAKLVREIIKDIYHENQMQLFFKKVELDYKEKYLLTKQSIRTLPHLPKKCLEEEKEKSITVNGSTTLELKDVEKENGKKS